MHYYCVWYLLVYTMTGDGASEGAINTPRAGGAYTNEGAVTGTTTCAGVGGERGATTRMCSGDAVAEGAEDDGGGGGEEDVW